MFICWNIFSFLFASVENDSKLQDVYWSAEKKSRNFTKAILNFVIVYDQSTYAMGFFYSIYFILIGQYDASTWPRWYALPVPFDTALIWGWYLYFLAAAIFDLIYILLMVSATAHFVGCCYYIEAMCKHIDRIVRSVQWDFIEYNNETDSCKRKAMKGNIPRKIQTAILKLIHTHIEINE